LSVSEMGLTLFAVNNGYFDDIETSKALAAEKSLREFVKSKYSALANSIETNAALSKEDEAALHEAVKAFKKSGAY
jgi:F-type H+/Na+-transporting ATPase subunit alpha